VSKEYPRFWSLGSYKYSLYRSKLYDYFQRHTRNASLVLDGGCGDEGGYVVSVSSSAHGIGLDIDRQNARKSLEKARVSQLNNLSFLAGDLENLPFSEEAFDVIVLCDVLEHVKTPEKAIRELAFSLRKGGRLLVCTTNKFNPIMCLDSMLPNSVSNMIIRRLGGPLHYERTRRFAPWELAQKLRVCGFNIESLLMFGYPPIGKPWVYHHSKAEPPMIFHCWILFDKITKFGFLSNFKEETLVVARL